jgi:hypothetical protein
LPVTLKEIIMDKPKLLMLSTVLVALAGFLSQAARAADDGEFDIDSKFRAKIVKEKVKQAALLNQANKAGQAGTSSADCGSQSIGNVNTGGRIGTAPREVFVFAPNAINLVSGQGCK